MNIAGAEFNRLSENIVHQTHDPRFACHRAEGILIIHVNRRVFIFLLHALRLAEHPLQKSPADKTELRFQLPGLPDQEGELVKIIGVHDKKGDRILLPLIGQTRIRIEKLQRGIRERLRLADFIFGQHGHSVGFRIEGDQFRFRCHGRLHQRPVPRPRRHGRVREFCRIKRPETLARGLFLRLRRGHWTRTPSLS